MKTRLIFATIVGIGVGFWVTARALRAYPSDPSPMEGITAQDQEEFVDALMEEMKRPINPLIAPAGWCHIGYVSEPRSAANFGWPVN